MEQKNVVFQASVFSQSGYGAHARSIVRALWESKKYNLQILPTGWGASSLSSSIDSHTKEILTYCCENQIPQGEDFVFIHLGIPTEFRKVGKINIGITAGLEADSVPESWIAPCNILDGLIVPSTFVRDSFVRGGVAVPIYVVPEDCESVETSESSSIALEPSFNFLTAGQWLLPGDRKNITQTIQMFCDTFIPSDDVGLVVKTYLRNNSSADSFIVKQNLATLLERNPNHPPIYLLTGEMQEDEQQQLFQHPKIKAFLTLSHGEGWGRYVAQAAWSGLPILATGWSGYMDFLHAKNCNLFEYDLVEVPPANFHPNLFKRGMRWAQPRLDDVKRKMRRCVEGYTVAKQRALELQSMMQSQFSRTILQDKLVDAIESIGRRDVVAIGGLS